MHLLFYLFILAAACFFLFCDLSLTICNAYLFFLPSYQLGFIYFSFFLQFSFFPSFYISYGLFSSLLQFIFNYLQYTLLFSPLTLATVYFLSFFPYNLALTTCNELSPLFSSISCNLHTFAFFL